MNVAPQAVRSSLRPGPVRLGRALPASVGLHVGILVLLLMGEALGLSSSAPLIDPDDVMEVTAVALPKQTTELAQKEMRTATPPPQAKPEVKPEPADEPVEPKPESKPEPVKPTVDHSNARADLLKELRKKEALKQVASDAPIGERDQALTSPDGVEGAVGTSRVGVGDPEYAAYIESIRQALVKHFSPIQTETLKARVEVKIDASGKIKDYEVAQKSGNASFDSAALRAVLKAGRVPAPPDKYKDAALNGIVIAFSNQ